MSESKTKADVFVALRKLSEIIPEMRAGQLVAAVGELCADLHGRGLWDASDVELLETVWQFQQNFERATAGAPAATERSAPPDHGGTNGSADSSPQQPPRQVS